ncbi:MAG: nucleotidyltransferase domain-containing protein [Defluviitaleaceae bacterium]|nr:nucleotidyltransferase domain-containing protein [Defluviitaleaceae bacterium]
MVSNEVRQTILEAKQYPYILRVGIFGSYARNEQTKISDLDIIIDYDNSSDDFLDNLDDFMEDMEIAYGDKIDYVTFPALMGSSDERFKRNVLNDVQWVYVAN